jgi:hypothetical protein
LNSRDNNPDKIAHPYLSIDACDFKYPTLFDIRSIASNVPPLQMSLAPPIKITVMLVAITSGILFLRKPQKPFMLSGSRTGRFNRPSVISLLVIFLSPIIEGNF